MSGYCRSNLIMMSVSLASDSICSLSGSQSYWMDPESFFGMHDLQTIYTTTVLYYYDFHFSCIIFSFDLLEYCTHYSTRVHVCNRNWFHPHGHDAKYLPVYEYSYSSILSILYSYSSTVVRIEFLPKSKLGTASYSTVVLYKYSVLLGVCTVNNTNFALCTRVFTVQ
jgi:hypothetical protein